VGSALPSLLFFPYVCNRRNVPDDLLIALNQEENFLAALSRTHPAELAALPRVALVIEEGYSKIFKHPYVTGFQPSHGRVRHCATCSAKALCHQDLGSAGRVGCAGQGTDSG
jgi:hypothetical protein